MSLLATQLVGFGSGGDAGFAAYFTEYTTAGTQTIPVPAGATGVIIECIGGGGGSRSAIGTKAGDVNPGGGGGAYSKTTLSSLVGYTDIYISVGAGGTYTNNGSDSFAKQNTSGGTTVCLAKGGDANTNGGAAGSGTGDLKYSGGRGGTGGVGPTFGGGGAASSAGDGGNTSTSTGGTSSGSPGGSGGNSGQAGNVYGGGCGFGNSANSGAKGYIKLSWS